MTPWFERVLLCLVGDALLLASYGVGTPFVLAALLVLATWAAPPAPEPARRPTTWPARLAAHRTTLLACGCVGLAAVGEPGPWRAAAVVVLLIAYLLLLDAFGPDRRRPRPTHTLAALAAAALVLPAALTDTGAGEWSRPLAVLGILTAATGLALTLRPRRK
ncbi:hypothetical protein [Kitasatospora sp. NPDC093806]|uniref:hypothetical protein n=1 Tax=Kitasatospora sp. NPDC093806 TaxID=3155075 RepID=UPI003438F0D5